MSKCKICSCYIPHPGVICEDCHVEQLQQQKDNALRACKTALKAVNTCEDSFDMGLTPNGECIFGMHYDEEAMVNAQSELESVLGVR